MLKIEYNENTPLLCNFQVVESMQSTTTIGETDSYKHMVTSIHTCETTVTTSSSSSESSYVSQELKQLPPQSIEGLESSCCSNETNPIVHTNPVSQSTSSIKKLKLLPLAILVFYNVSGGPFGIEPALFSAGNLYTIIGFLIVPFIWSVPEALVTAELGSAFHHDSSGGVAWVDEAFGEKWGLVCGYLGWIAGATDNAIYPTLFLHYLISVVHHSKQPSDGGTDTQGLWDVDVLFDDEFLRFGFVAVLSILLAYVNYRGLEIVGNASIVVCIIAMSPFVIMSIIGVTQIEPRRWLQLPDPNITQCMNYDYYYSDDDDDLNGPNGGSMSTTLSSWFGAHIGQGILWTPFLNNLFWNLNSFDSASSFAGEVQSVSTTYPHGIFLGLFLSIILYIIPLLVITGSTDYEQCDWVDGQLGKAAIDIGGKWLGTWTVLAAGISNLALFEAEMSADSYQLMGMAERGHLPKIFAMRSGRYGTPIVGIVVCTTVIIAMSVADFTQLVELLNFNYSIALLMEYLAFIKLRLTRKDCKYKF